MSAPDRGTPYRPVSASGRRGILANAGSTLHGLRLGLLSVLFILPLLSAFAPNVFAQTLPSVTITRDGPASVAEGTRIRFWVSLSSPHNGSFAVNLQVTDAPNANFLSSGSEGEGARTRPFLGGTSRTQFFVQTDADSTAELNGPITVKVLPGALYTIGNPSSASVTVTDNDGPLPTSTVNFSSSTYSGDEGDGISVRVNISPPRNTATTLPITYTNGTASNGDYSKSPSSVTIPANTGFATFNIPTTEDNADEANETFTVAIGTVPFGITKGSPSSATVTINDDDSTVRFGSLAYSGNEGDPVSVRVNISPQRSTPTILPITYTNGTAGNGDYSKSPSSVTIPANTGFAEFNIPTTGDNEDEDNETFNIAIGTVPSGITKGSPSTATVTINDDDGTTATTVSFGSSAYSGNEGDEIRVRVNINPQRSTATILPITYTNGTAGSSDYNNSQTSVTIPADTGFATFNIPTTEDNEDEDNETFNIAIGTVPLGITKGSPSSATVTINDDDGTTTTGPTGPTTDPTDPQVPQVSFGSVSHRVTEDDGQIEVEILLTPAPTDAVTLRYTVAGTASVGTDADFQILPRIGSVMVAAGQSRVVIPVTLTDDEEAESDETVILTLVDGEGYTLNQSASLEHTLTVTDNDSGPRPQPGPEKPQEPQETMKETVSSVSLLRFGGAVTDQVLDGVLGRVESLGRVGAEGLEVTRSDLLQGAAFTLSSRARTGHLAGFWGNGALGNYQGEEDGIRVDGEVTSVFLGHDMSGRLSAGQPWLAGALLSRNLGEDDWLMAKDRGQVEHSLTTLVPYGSMELSQDLRLWGALGWGRGDMEIRSADQSTTTDTAWRMLAAGFRRNLDSERLVERESFLDGVELSLNGDIRRTRTQSDPVGGIGSTSGRVTRARLGIEASKTQELENGATVRPSLEIGLRRDGGDAERGRGVEIGAGIRWSNPSGLGGSMQGRTVTLRSEEELQDRSLSVSVDWDPRPGSALGLSASLGLDTGDVGSSLLFDEGFWNDRDFDDTQRQWRAQAAYGMHTYGRGRVGSPYLTLAGDDHPEKVRLGYRVSSERSYESVVDLQLDLYLGMDQPVGEETDLGAGLGLRLLW